MDGSSLLQGFETIQDALGLFTPLRKENIECLMQYSHEEDFYVFRASAIHCCKRYRFVYQFPKNVDYQDDLLEYEETLREIAFNEIKACISQDDTMSVFQTLEQSASLFRQTLSGIMENVATAFAPRVEPEEPEKVDWVREGF